MHQSKFPGKLFNSGFSIFVHPNRIKTVSKAPPAAKRGIVPFKSAFKVSSSVYLKLQTSKTMNIMTEIMIKIIGIAFVKFFFTSVDYILI